MDCVEVEGRLVALEDGELAPSEARQVREHLLCCPGCAALGLGLARTRPASPWLDQGPGRAPTAVLQRLSQHLDVDKLIAAAAAAPRSRPSRFAVALRALQSPASVPMGAVFAYLVVLALTGFWGMSNYWALTARTTASPAPAEIPADQFRPASYDPAVDGSP